MIPIFIISALIFLNAIFVAAEFALVGAPKAAVEARADRGDRIACRVRRILRDARQQDQYIATAQLGITFASLGLGMYGEHIVAAWFEAALHAVGLADQVAEFALATVLAVALLTYFHIVLGEMVPKTLALQRAEHTVMWITPPMMAIRRALYPLVLGLNGLGNLVLRLLGVQRQAVSQQSFYTAEELEFVIAESREAGLLRPDAARVLSELLEFRHLKAGEVMTPRVRVTGVPVNASPSQIASIVSTSPHTRYPVYERNLDQILGEIHVKALLRAVLENRTLRTETLREIAFVPETADSEAVIAAMRRLRMPMAIVMDEHGGTAGLVTLQDLFEEVVGEISDDRIPASVYRQGDHVMALGTARLSEVGAHLGFELEHPEVDSVSGLVLALLGRPPVVGDNVEYGPVRFTITSVTGHGVGSCRCTLVATP